MARAGIALNRVAPGESMPNRCERGFALQMRRDKGTVELTGFYFIQEHRFIMGFGWGRNPLRWFWDQRRFAHNQPLLAEWTSQRNRGSPHTDQGRSQPRHRLTTTMPMLNARRAHQGRSPTQLV